MDHFEALSLADDLHAGSLPAPQAASLQAHVDACEGCRAILGQWQSAAGPDLWPGLQARLNPRAQAWGPAWLTPALATLALLLCVSAFWHPERAWLRADRAWAYSSQAGGRP